MGRGPRGRAIARGGAKTRSGAWLKARNPSCRLGRRQPHLQTPLPTEEAALLAPGLQVHHALPEQHNQQILQGRPSGSQFPQTFPLCYNPLHFSPSFSSQMPRIIPCPHSVLVCSQPISKCYPACVFDSSFTTVQPKDPECLNSLHLTSLT